LVTASSIKPIHSGKGNRTRVLLIEEFFGPVEKGYEIVEILILPARKGVAPLCDAQLAGEPAW
jgi:hypothetical protein